MTDRPIIMQANSVRAILDGRKTQTRWVVKLREFQASTTRTYDWMFRDRRMLWNDLTTDTLLASRFCPYRAGDRLWVKEAWKSNEGSCNEEPQEDDHECGPHCHQVYVYYRATPRVGFRPTPDSARITYLALNSRVGLRMPRHARTRSGQTPAASNTSRVGLRMPRHGRRPHCWKEKKMTDDVIRFCFCLLLASCSAPVHAWRVSGDLVGPAKNAAYEWAVATDGLYEPVFDRNGADVIRQGTDCGCARYRERRDISGMHREIIVNLQAMQAGECGPAAAWFGTASAYIAACLGMAAGVRTTLPPGLGVLSAPPGPHVTEVDAAEVFEVLSDER